MRNFFRTKHERKIQEQQQLPLKNLKLVNKTRRKEPPKSWGRGERLTVLFVLLVTVSLSAGLALSARNYKLPGLPKLKFSLPNFSSKTIIIEGNREYQKKAEKTKNSFKEKTNKLSGVYALYVVDLDSGFAYGVNENEKMQAASLIKLPVIAALYSEVESGVFDLYKEYTLKNSDKITGSGSLYSKPAGTVLTYQDMVGLMGKESDNTSFGIVRSALGTEKIKAEIAKIGMSSTSVETNMTTPKDIGLFFQKLWDNQIMNQKHKDELLGYLTDTIYENWLTAGVPDEVRVAHKYGREVHVVNDAGVVYTKKPFVLVIMSDGAIAREADEIFPDLARGVYEVLAD